jgi:hypothetical protein
VTQHAEANEIVKRTTVPTADASLSVELRLGTAQLGQRHDAGLELPSGHWTTPTYLILLVVNLTVLYIVVLTDSQMAAVFAASGWLHMITVKFC